MRANALCLIVLCLAVKSEIKGEPPKPVWRDDNGGLLNATGAGHWECPKGWTFYLDKSQLNDVDRQYQYGVPSCMRKP